VSFATQQMTSDYNETRKIGLKQLGKFEFRLSPGRYTDYFVGVCGAGVVFLVNPPSLLTNYRKK